MCSGEKYEKGVWEDGSPGDKEKHEQALRVIYMPAMPPLGIFVWSKNKIKRLLETIRS